MNPNQSNETPESNGSRNYPRRRASDFAPASNLLSMMAAGNGPLPEDEVRDDHLITSTLPGEQSVVDSDGHMDSHRKPIISINGKDINDHELGKNVA